MAALDNTSLVQRFIKLPAAQRRLFLEKLGSKGITLAQLPIPVSRHDQPRLPLSYAQQRQWFLWQLEPGSSAYHIPAALHLRGALDIAALERALSTLVVRHEALRTVFETVDGEAVQVVQPAQPLVIEKHAATSDGTPQSVQIKAFIDATLEQPFDLLAGPLLRVKLLQLGAEEQVLVIAQHHIVSDGWSMQIMVRELVELYQGYSQGHQVSLPVLPIQYADYAIWQRCWMEAGERERQLAYWTEQLGGEQSLLQLPHDRPRPAISSYRGQRCDIDIEPALTAALKQACRREGVTLFMLLLASFQVLLYRYSGQADIRVGVPVASRNRAECERLIGFFVNTQVLKADVIGTDTLSELLQQVKRTALQAQDYQDLPYEQLVEALQPERSLSHNPLFQVMFNHQVQGPVQAGQGADMGLGIEALTWDNHTSPFDLNLDTFEDEQRLWASMTYAVDLFDAATIQGMAAHWRNLLEAFAATPQVRIDDLPLLGRDEEQRMLTQWNHTHVDRPGVPFVHQWVAQRDPAAVALHFGPRSLNCAELNARANRLAAHLIEQGVGPDVLVGVAFERSVEMVVALLAVHRAGGAYVPLDPDYPQQRLAYMIADSGIGLLLTHAPVVPILPALEHVQLQLLDESDAAPATDPGVPDVALDPEHLAYVIYTSGSTGQPKGVAIRHRGLSNHMQWMRGYLPLTADDRVLQKTAFSFDASVWEFWLPLMGDAQLVMAPPSLSQDWAGLWSLVAAERISVLQLAPSLLQGVLPQADAAQLRSLSYLLAGGEALKASLVTQLNALWQGTLINLYGPTEATIDSCSFIATPQATQDIVAIGRPLDNVRTYVLNDGLAVCPVGGAGELYIAGDCLARGYFNRAALTAERFVPNPFDSQGSRLYRSGDRVRYRADGVLDYIGRLDHQLKLRGLRIELGEIEARLGELDAVREAVVLAQEVIQGTQLVAYVVAHADAAGNSGLPEQIKARLTEVLPAYMVPTQVLLLAALPLMPNGKLDRKALPLPDAAHADAAYSAPQGALEEQIAEIWQAVLKRTQVGRQDNFFELGGDSIISIQVVSRARQAGIDFTPKELFQHQTVQGLASVARQGASANRIDQGPVSGELALLPIQQMFFQSAVADRHHWNQSVLLQPREHLEVQGLEQALTALVCHHDALRLSFVDGGPQGWRASYRTPGAGSGMLWHEAVSDNAALLAACERAQRSLDIANGPLVRGVLFDLADGTQRLLLIVHHLVVDGVSWRILFEDLQTAYRQGAAALPAKTSSLKTWTQRLGGHHLTTAGAAAAAYWLNLPVGADPALPCEHPDASLQKQHAASVSTRLDRQATSRLLQQAPATYRTQVNDLLLTALARVICNWTGGAEAWVQLEGHGREDLFDDVDLTRTVGWLTSAFPARLTPHAELGVSIKAIKEQLRAIPNKGLDFGILRYLGTPDQQAALARLPVPRITFNYLGQFDGSFDDDTALFVPAKESAGAEQGDDAPLGNWLSINGQVYGGELTLEWTFSNEMFAPHTVQHLADALTAQLLELIEHCSDAEHSSFTPSDFPLSGLDQAQLDQLPVERRQVSDLYPLSPMQQGMLFHGLFEADSGDYINQLRVDIEGLDVETFRAAWQATLQAHDVLRSGFYWQGDLSTPVQVVFDQVVLPFSTHDLRGTSDQPARLKHFAEQEKAAGFALDTAPLLRLALVRTAEQRHHLIYTSHHILMDGWSNAQLLGEVLQRYAGTFVPTHNGRYRDYIAWLQARDMQASEAFWKQQTQALSGPTLLAAAIPRSLPATRGTGRGEHRVLLDQLVTQGLNSFARQQKITFNTLVQAAWSLLLQRYTGQQTVAFGATVSGRPAELRGIEGQIGLFINTLPVISQPLADQPIGQWLQGLQALNLSLREQEHTPLYEIQRWAGRSGEALFDNLLVFENYPVSEALAAGAPQGLRFGEVLGHEQTSFPLTLLVDAGAQLALTFKYAEAEFDAPVIQALADHLRRLIEAICSGSSERCVGELMLLNPAEYAQQMHQWNATQTLYPLQSSVQQLIEAQVERTPDEVALTAGEQQLSYRELNRRANRLAHHLVGLGVGPDVLVGIALERSVEMVVALLAVLKAGGAYVPLDPDYPTERLAYMQADSGIRWLLSHSALTDDLPQVDGVQRLLLDQLALAGSAEHNPQVAVAGENLAYVIYTSGSTGQPKGAGNRHSALTNRLCWMQDAYGLTAADNVLQKTPFSFDVSVWEFFWPLLAGARLVMAAPGAHRDPAQLIEVISREQISTLHFVPSMLQVFLQDPNVQACRSLTRIVCSGEALPAEAAQQVFKQLPHAGLYNLYGPTEAAIDVTHWTCQDDDRHSVPIGHPIANLHTYVLDGNLQPLPVGVVGELYLAGEGLARGYHQRPALTAERFVVDPFVAGQRMYRTGDLARFGRAGEIEYAGRIDHQVKIRGLRIELGEIEAGLLAHPQVLEAVVVAAGTGAQQMLVGYLVCEGAVVLEDIRSSLRSHLPEFMVPTHLLVLDQMPLSANGKLDRKLLPAPDAALSRAVFQAPRDEFEQAIAGVWQAVLGLTEVGLDDNFFQLGGHSLMATQVVMQLRQLQGVEVPLKLLFETPHLGAFCEHVRGLQSGHESLEDELTKSLGALKRLSAEELEKLIS
ncbi:non-ribosomal peptide synthetase [Pseudomonas sp. S09G 359]|jgi:amino acid adenylation domain-containing protein/non-ribosomal peptide synthase protein (TIGR01720 family)|uniref:non-ribosomal peptide synthetase n=1 Tax=Pseudomonas sp. S09G 359 TaxID=2054919 RepID=UPI000C6E656E|nr:non-ribosomal peptide synthetase [Pseudomonas sp. S09G 359]AUG07230.1 non-ribosomal peptide synthetase [Pseudomonas sp. S09G 359]